MLKLTYSAGAPAFLLVALLCACSASGSAATGSGDNAATGGAKNTGGSEGTIGGTSSAGATGGGPTSTGGSKAAGGAVPTGGGKATGGAAPTGGSKATGGAAPTGGGKTTGGSTTSSSSSGNWTTGYVATMYGDVDVGDCAAYRTGTGTSQLFGDQTPIATYTCGTNGQNNGPRKVTLSSFQSGVANNSSYYAALGDLSSLWTANGNAATCACNGSEPCTPSCNAEISSTGSCGICIAVKCDPDSTWKDSSGYSHSSNCNKTQYVVVQNMDACPHNHSTNVASAEGWCTSRQAQHIDLSCSGLGDISDRGTNVGQLGWLPVAVQLVDCSVGLGKHSL